MPTTQHSTLTGAELHEPKGVAAATNNQVYVSDGSASGDWTALYDTYTVDFEDISTAQVVYIPILHSGTVTKVSSVIDSSITVADATITPKNAAGASMEAITVAYSGSAAGDVDTVTVATNNAVTADSFMSIETDGGSSTTTRAHVVIKVERT